MVYSVEISNDDFLQGRVKKCIRDIHAPALKVASNQRAQ